MPQPNRRAILGGLAATLAAPAIAQAPWPNRPVKLIVPYAPGGATDTLARPWADKLSQAFGQPFVIENRGGASGMIGAEAAARSAPDGYTLLHCPVAVLCVMPQLRKLGWEPRRDLEPVGRLGDLHCGFVVVNSLGLNTLAELIDYAKKNPGKLSYGSAGLGSSAHLRIEMLKLRTGTDILHVPYRGSADAINDLLSGTVQLMNEIIVLPHVKAGKLKLLCINHEQRNPEFPDVKTLTELGYPNSDVPIWGAIQVPRGTPKDIIRTLNAKMVEIAKSEDMIRRLREISVICPTMTPEELLEFTEKDYVANGELIRAAKVTLD
ncbi:MAG: Bug family tripartite tricarboxylate transporter substrate binding protein [Acetobacteraceae bacterium]